MHQTSIYNVNILNPTIKSPDACDIECWGKPFTDIISANIKLEPGEYLEKLDDTGDYDFDRAPWSFRTRNFQSFEICRDFHRKKTDFTV